MVGEPILWVENLKVWFPVRAGLIAALFQREQKWVKAVDGVSFDVRRGEIFTLVGESGCGKTTTGKAVVRILNPTEGDMFFNTPLEVVSYYRRLLKEISDTEAILRPPQEDGGKRLDPAMKRQLHQKLRNLYLQKDNIRNQYAISFAYKSLPRVIVENGHNARLDPLSTLVNSFRDPRRAVVGRRWRHKRRLASLRRQLQMIFQDPYESLNPKHSIFNIVAEPLVVNKLERSPSRLEKRVAKALEDAGLRPASEFMFRFPHELSGGQRQRVSVASALVLEPTFLVADEPVSMLDASVRTEILKLLLDLRRDKNLTFIFITHDLSLAWVISDRIAVMYLGRIVEQGSAEEVIKHPRHPYTQSLISVVPITDPTAKRKKIILAGERPDPIDIPRGCRFHPRCPVAIDICGWEGEEGAAQLKEVIEEEAAQGASDKDFIEEVKAVGPFAFQVVLRESDEHTYANLESRIRHLIEVAAKKHVALKAVRQIGRQDNVIHVSMFEAEEPPLKEVKTGVFAACVLVSS